ncbi:MAG: DUF2779 domain-containing protein [Clostridia bacterium]
MKISKSRFIDYRQCPKRLWLGSYRKELADETDQAAFQMGTMVGELARDLFPGGVLVEYNGADGRNIANMIDRTKALITTGEKVIYEAAFAHEGTFAICDILARSGNAYDILEVKASTGVKDVYIDDVAFQRRVLESCKISVNRVYILHVNSGYVRHGALDLNRLFTREDVTERADNIRPGIESSLLAALAMREEDGEPEVGIGMHCENPYTCPFKGYCFRHVPENSVFDIAGMQLDKKFRLYRDGIITFGDIRKGKIKLTGKAMVQVDARLDDSEFINKERIKGFIDSLGYPLYFLDFETINPAIPLFDGTRPFQQIPTQYSLHYIDTENAPPRHSEFLAEEGTDPRRLLAERLAADIPRDACVLAYNMTFEKTIIRQLAAMYPDLSESLNSIVRNMHDLMLPFQNRYLYKKDMRGSHSIKNVLPALFPDDPELSYDNLGGVSNGREASAAYLSLPHLAPEDRERIRRELLEYCRLDTLAMVRIWEELGRRMH